MKKVANKKFLKSMKLVVVFCLICAVVLSGCINNEQNNNGTKLEKNDMNINSSCNTTSENNEAGNASVGTKQVVTEADNGKSINLKTSENNEIGNASIETKQVVTEADNGTSMNLKNGDTFFLKLRETPSTGYSWQLNLSQGLSILSDKYTEDPAPEGQNGVSGTHSWEIKAVTQGSKKVEGIYKQPWMDTTGTESKFMLNVEVTNPNLQLVDTLSNTSSPQLGVTLSSHTNGSNVSFNESIYGNSTGVYGTGLHLYVLVNPVTSGDTWWVQPETDVSSDGSWHVNAQFGQSAQENTGSKFGITAIVTSDSLPEGLPEGLPDENTNASSGVEYRTENILVTKN